MSPLAASLLAVALAVAAVATVHAGPPPCTTFLHPILPCTAYITGHGPTVPVPVPCCKGLKFMVGLMITRADRVTACKCFKDAAVKMPDIDYGRVAALPGRCHVDAPFNFSPHINCDA
ncbi:non-specific lipid-transfer protein P5-like [Zingiber officinale]|uniref:Bifunctional inhibitor/plant lipid transfer protein/seed storage helical domain-containing protein n=1 Tax=Zingiber officinale TaxID=94328 RepID=A0A8J5FYB9_ZINOF|nr:non-specific lipid-transfer protein P5-like [Zingiber officinale]KAG6494467.1 hypothetical protein ZIOFF_049499 [Zingiber officinale]